MKFSALAVLAFSAVGVSAMPEAFVEQCCVGVPLPAPHSGITDEISGYNNDFCRDDTLGGNVYDPRCITLEDVCLYFTFAVQGGMTFPVKGTDAPTGIIATGSAGLNCCRAWDNPAGADCMSPSDNPWTCATLIDWSASFPGEDGPTYTEDGFYCGRTNACKASGCVIGDPHFQTFSGDWFDFHGECDLKFLEIKEFADFKGLQIQLRTKQRYEYSYVEAAAIQIGDEILEVGSHGQYFFNGVENADLKHAAFLNKYRIEHEIRDTQHHIFNIYTGIQDHTGKVEKIQIKTFKDLVAVKVDNAFESTFSHSEGMMGDYFYGKMFARDGKTVISDPIEFGMEWQVRPEDGELFQTPSPIEGKCKMPSSNAEQERRRLGEAIPLEAAVAACEAVDTIHHENCVYDVMATGDLEIAHAGVF
jgi:hypothetical protein